jgi:hypothetical protein
MSLMTYWNKKVKKLDWSDIALLKLYVAAVVLLIAKLWTPLLSLDWYWYLVIAVLAGAKPVYTFYIK